MNKIKTSVFLIFLICSLHSNILLAQPALQLPLSCDLGNNCWIVNYVDTDNKENEYSDFKCGNRTYDSHQGTDFAIRDMVTMETGVDVLAAADGTVLRLRDEMPDQQISEEKRKELLTENKGCGNGVAIDHGQGWQTIYCHMKKDSISVKENQTVKAGDKIGEIGHSGASEFPHLHLSVLFEGTTIDPFTGKDTVNGCNNEENPLWKNTKNKISYSPFEIFATGFKTDIPDIDALKIDIYSPDTASSDINALVFWVGAYGLEKNDQIELKIAAPNQTVFAQKIITQDRPRARQYYYIGRRINNILEKGNYTGTIKIIRNKDQIKEMNRTILIQ